jgi:hypothetical protein
MDRQNNEDTKQDTKSCQLMDRQNNEDTKQDTESCQLMDRQNNEDTKQDSKAVHQLTALVSCLVSCSYVGHCFVGPSIDSFGILFGIL